MEQAQPKSYFDLVRQWAFWVGPTQVTVIEINPTMTQGHRGLVVSCMGLLGFAIWALNGILLEGYTEVKGPESLMLIYAYKGLQNQHASLQYSRKKYNSFK